MKIYRTYNKFIFNGQVYNQGDINMTTNVPYYYNYKTWRVDASLPSTPDFNVITFEPLAFDITSKVQLAYNSPGENISLFTLSNGNEVNCFYNSNTTSLVMQFLDNGIVREIYNASGGWLSYISNITKVIFSFAILIDDNAQPKNDFFMLIQYQSGAYFYNYLMVHGPSNNINILLNGVITDLDDPYITNNNQTPTGGYGDFNFTGDDDLPPDLPTASASQVGFVSLWNPTQQEMRDLASYMWSNSIFDVSTWKKLFADPMECILSVGIIPVNPSISAAKENIQIGNISTNVQAYRITNQFVSVDFGKINLKGQSASYMDYAPYCRASIYLPYCGDFALNVDDIMDAEMSLEYHIDIYTGACVAYLSIRRTNSDGSVLNSTLYQFTGNVLSSIPITASDHSAFIQSLLFMGAGIAATVATGGAGAPAIAGASAGDVAIGGAAAGLTTGSAINTVMSMKPDVQRSGNLSSTAGFLGKQKPCLTIHWSNLCRPSDEYKLVGMPLHKSGTLSDFSGFTIVSAVHMDDIPCTADELKLIEEALYKGVII